MRLRLHSLYLLGVLLALLLGICFAVQPVDGYVGNVRLLFTEDDTEWADAYTDSGFQAVRVGMSRSEVYKLLGIPLSARLYSDGTAGECWTQNPYESSYRRREVIFDKDYQVIRTIAEVVIQHEPNL